MTLARLLDARRGPHQLVLVRHGQSRANVADAEARIAQSKAKAMANVSDIAAETASAVVGKLLGKEVSKDEVQRALVQRAAE